MTDVLELTPRGLYCCAGDFFIDPWRPVDRAVVTHAHADHARPGSKSYLTSTRGQHVLQTRMGQSAKVETLDYGEPTTIGEAKVSLHPAGHILGSAQVRIEVAGEVWVVAGDYKTDVGDRTCTAFEPVRCHTFVTESTFGLPVYRWPKQEHTYGEINTWWRSNQAEGRTSMIGAYSLGKAQRVLAGLDPNIGEIYCHGAAETCNKDYRNTGVELPATQYAGRSDDRKAWSGAMIIAPPSALGSTWMRKFGDVATGFASGWMMLRGPRRRHGVERGFVLSDHADWYGLLDAIEATGAERVLVTHGSSDVLVRYLKEERGLDSHALKTFFGDEDATNEKNNHNDNTPDDDPQNKNVD